MDVLIDYDNVDVIERRRGILNVIHTVLGQLPASLLAHGARFHARLYGGWYDRRHLSRRAQKLTGEIATHFPAVLAVQKGVMAMKVRVTAELARSLSIDPARDLLHTYRVRGVPPNLQPKTFPFSGCVRTSACPLAGAHSLLRHGHCSEPSCQVGLPNVMTRPEQKLVDTMLTADLIHVASSGSSDVVVVSTDDDLWPGIRSAVHLGAKVHHVHPQAGRATPQFYSSGIGSNYQEYSF